MGLSCTLLSTCVSIKRATLLVRITRTLQYIYIRKHETRYNIFGFLTSSMWSVTYLQIKLLWCILDIFVILKALVKIAWNRWDLLFLNCGWLLSYETEQNHTRWQTVKSNKKSWNTFGQRYVTSSSWIVLLNPTPTNLQRSIPVFSSINVSTNRLRVPFTVNLDVKISVLKLSEAFDTIRLDHGSVICSDRAYASLAASKKF